MSPWPGGWGGPQRAWLKSSSARTGDHSARFEIRGRNTRSCDLKLENRHITRFSVHGDGGKGLQKGHHIPEEGLNKINLLTREFDKDLIVDIEWKEEDESSSSAAADPPVARVSCGWLEYESGTVGGGASGGTIPSFEEALAFLPEWAVVTTHHPPLVDAGFNHEV